MLLSRGQQKLFLLALTFAQAKLIERVNRVKPILLIDDIGAELDINSRTLLSSAIDKLNCQVIITAIDRFALEPLVSTNNNYKMFHVEQGEILEFTDVDKS
jgi:DNA replication and repair protein RecF